MSFRAFIPLLTKGKMGHYKGTPIQVDEAFLDRAMSSYNPAYHDAPLAFEPIKDTSPAYGWVESLKRIEDTIYAHVNTVDENLANDLATGRRKARTVQFYPSNNSLKRVIISGDTPPIAGRQWNFSQEDLDAIEFSENRYEKGGSHMNAGELLEAKVKAILLNPPKFDHWGRRFDREVDYSMAFSMACAQNPELAELYVEEVNEARKIASIPALLRK